MRVQPSGSKVPQPGILQQTGPVRTLTAGGWSFPVPEGQPVTFENLPGYWTLQMAELACVAYDVFGSVEWQQHRFACAQGAPIKSRTTSLDWHGRKLVIFEAGHIKAVATHLEDHRCVAFRGTVEWRDWESDGSLLFTDPLGIHRGFRRAWQSIRGEVVRWLEQGEQPILAGGHSLGGALATLAAWDLSVSFPVAGVITLAAPRVGSAAFARDYERRKCFGTRTLGEVTRRLVAVGDTVPMVPFPPLYRHAGQEFYLQPCPPSHDGSDDKLKNTQKSDTAMVRELSGALARAIQMCFAPLVPRLDSDELLKEQKPWLASGLTAAFFWLCYWFSPRSYALARWFGEWLGPYGKGASLLILAFAAEQATYLVPFEATVVLRWAAALAVAGALIWFYPATAGAAAWTASIVIVVLVLAFRFAAPGAALEHPKVGYLRALECDAINSDSLGPNACVLKSLGLPLNRRSIVSGPATRMPRAP